MSLPMFIDFERDLLAREKLRLANRDVQGETAQLVKRAPVSNSGNASISTNEILDNYGYGRYQWLLAITCALSRSAAFSHLFLCTAVVSNQNVYWKLSVLEDRMVYTVLALFCMIGSVVGGKLADIYGRKQLLFPGTIVASVAMIIGSITPHYYLFIVCNVVAGVAVGSNLTISSCLYGELIPNTCRSHAMLTINILTVAINIFICTTIYCFLYQAGWRWHYGVVAVPNLLAFGSTWFLADESPRYYGAVGHTEGQLYVLAHIKTRNKPSFSYSADEENLKNTVTIERGTWKGLTFRFFVPTLTLSLISFSFSAVMTMITFSIPLMEASNYCQLQVVLEYIGRGKWTDSDQFEYLMLAITYGCLIVGGTATHYWLSEKRSRRFSLYVLFSLLLVSFLPQMQCFHTFTLVVSCIVTVMILGGIMHVLTLCVIEIFPTYVRATAMGVVFAASFLGTLYGPYVDIFIKAGNLKSTYLVFFVLVGTIFVLVNSGIRNTENMKLFETKDDINKLHESGGKLISEN